MTALRFGVYVLSVAALVLLPAATARTGKPDGGEAVLTNSLGMRLARIPAGKFRMGSPADEPERDPEEVLHEVAITRPFYLGVYEVTQAQYQRLMGKNPAFFNMQRGGGPDHPVEQVRWAEAVEFCNRLSNLAEERKAGRAYRLPTEAEWEYACRAGTGTPFHAGKGLSSTQANFNGKYPYGEAAAGPYLGKTAKVGSYAPNAWGLYDMHGNVAEWCSDWYDPDYYKNSPKGDPTGPPKGVQSTGYKDQFFRVARGGCWLDEGRGCRAAYRFRFQPSEPYRLLGFRVACVVGGEKKDE
jgi:formylglycine-generating enzyme required for sulfatase activity